MMHQQIRSWNKLRPYYTTVTRIFKKIRRRQFRRGARMSHSRAPIRYISNLLVIPHTTAAATTTTKTLVSDFIKRDQGSIEWGEETAWKKTIRTDYTKREMITCRRRKENSANVGRKFLRSHTWTGGESCCEISPYMQTNRTAKCFREESD